MMSEDPSQSQSHPSPDASPPRWMRYWRHTTVGVEFVVTFGVFVAAPGGLSR